VCQRPGSGCHQGWFASWHGISPGRRSGSILSCIVGGGGSGRCCWLFRNASQGSWIDTIDAQPCGDTLLGWVLCRCSGPGLLRLLCLLSLLGRLLFMLLLVGLLVGLARRMHVGLLRLIGRVFVVVDQISINSNGQQRTATQCTVYMTQPSFSKVFVGNIIWEVVGMFFRRFLKGISSGSRNG
jgi:hypothetical protein